MHIVYLESSLDDIEWMRFYYSKIFPAGKKQASIGIFHIYAKVVYTLLFLKSPWERGQLARVLTMSRRAARAPSTSLKSYLALYTFLLIVTKNNKSVNLKMKDAHL